MNDDLNKIQEDIVDFQKEINNLMKISQTLENLPMMGSNNMMTFGSCIQSLNMIISNLIQYSQKEKQVGDNLGAD